jgi:hypothetical protein
MHSSLDEHLYEINYTAWSTITESVGNETIKNTGDFCLVIGTDHALTGFFNLRSH